MRIPTLVLAATLLALPAAAQEDDPEYQAKEPDYSKESLMRIFSAKVEPEPVEAKVKYEFGRITFRIPGTRVRFSYLPFFAPFSGSVPKTYKTFPDPFELTGTEIAMTPRTFRDRKAYSAERRRLEKLMKGKGTVKVETKATP